LTSESDEDQEVSNSSDSHGPADEQRGAWKHVLWEALHSTALRSSFACSGRLHPSLLPNVTVAGVGRLKLPLSKKQAASLKAVAEQAPHGKGLRTVVDTTVRDALHVRLMTAVVARG